MTALPRRRGWRPAYRPADETGSIALFLLVAVLALFAVFGLVVDGGRRLDGQRRATDIAEQAARAAAQAVDTTALRAGTGLRLDPAAARRAAATYMSAAPDVTLTAVTVDQTGVTVTVTTAVHPTVLSVAGIDTLTVTGTGHAQLLTPPGTDTSAANALSDASVRSSGRLP